MNNKVQDPGFRVQTFKKTGGLRFMLYSAQGVTLVEIIVVVAVIGILLTVVGFQFEGWLTRYNVENEIKNMYVDLMNARARAMQRNRAHFVVLTTGTMLYTVYEDTNPAPDGNGTYDAGLDTQVVALSKTLQRTINWNGGGNITFSTQGLASPLGTIDLTSTADPDYDCIVISMTRINLGKYSGGSCNVK